MTSIAISASRQPSPSLQHEWEAWPEFDLSPARLSTGTPCLPLSTTWYFSDPPAVMERRESREGERLSPKVPEQAQVLPPEVSRGTATFIYFGPCSKTLVASCLE